MLKLKKKGGKRVSAFAIENIEGKKILLVEDMIETGHGMMGGREFLESKGAHVKTACLYTMAHTKLTPDFSLKVLPGAPTFPWSQT